MFSLFYRSVSYNICVVFKNTYFKVLARYQNLSKQYNWKNSLVINAFFGLFRSPKCVNLGVECQSVLLQELFVLGELCQARRQSSTRVWARVFYPGCILLFSWFFLMRQVTPGCTGGVTRTSVFSWDNQHISSTINFLKVFWEKYFFLSWCILILPFPLNF